MAASKTPDQAHAPVLDALANFLAHHAPQHITLAYSGGMDSTVLLHALIRLQP
ncbi:MAG TPA: tRNA(Ile)-lysidine synthetase, partial [Piscirickettsiaceae bacterium]|nr:tRNA(Ile)-lysidine synthetase [Piscirickettsiaceae bacterium]